MTAVSSARSKAYMLTIIFTFVVLGVSAHVNVFQGFFYVADQFPLVLSVLTLLFLISALVASSHGAWASRPLVELCWLGALLITWTGANAFSTSRWAFVQPSDCDNIPVDTDPDFLGQSKTWCHEIQALRAFVWIEWASLLICFGSLLAFCLIQSRNGARHIWTTPLSNFDPFTSPHGLHRMNSRVADMEATSNYRASNGRDLDLDFDFAPRQMHQPSLAEEQRYSWPPPPQSDKAFAASEGLDLGPVPPLPPGQYGQYAMPSTLYAQSSSQAANQRWESFYDDDKTNRRI